jgi:hypothetical protein
VENDIRNDQILISMIFQPVLVESIENIVIEQGTPANDGNIIIEQGTPLNDGNIVIEQ